MISISKPPSFVVVGGVELSFTPAQMWDFLAYVCLLSAAEAPLVVDSTKNYWWISAEHGTIDDG
jgi:hypothetical protein